MAGSLCTAYPDSGAGTVLDNRTEELCTTRSFGILGLMVACVAFALLVLVPREGVAQTAMRKAGRGLAAMTCSFLEVPGNMIIEGEKQGSGGVALGFAKGLGMIVPRVLVGVYEFVTCPIPAPADFRSILKPEFPWDSSTGARPRHPPPATGQDPPDRVRVWEREGICSRYVPRGLPLRVRGSHRVRSLTPSATGGTSRRR